MGELVKLYKDQEIPADMVILKSSKDSGLCFVDTMNLDGETNLKERNSIRDI
jgi:P-type E1-E2 ATPase